MRRPNRPRQPVARSHTHTHTGIRPIIYPVVAHILGLHTHAFEILAKRPVRCNGKKIPHVFNLQKMVYNLRICNYGSNKDGLNL